MSGAVGHDSALSERYAIERELGRGGMGVVFLARDLRHDRNVAIKFLPADLASAVGDARFTREIRTLARLSHPHILPLHDSGVAEGELYYVMPHVDGESLRQRLDREGALRVPEALRIARQVADALAYAHARGVVHRDIKPENILLDHHGHAYVADFGIARVLQSTNDGSRLTSIAVRMGSPAYMSPEQVAGEPNLDGRSDIYSLGCILFEMLAAEPPFADRSAQVLMRRHLLDDPPSLRERRADVAPALDDVLGAMLAKAPDDRFATADALAIALDAEIARVTGEGTAPRLLPRRRRRLRRLALAGAASAVGLAVLVWGLGADVRGIGFLAGAPPDSTKWLVLPLEWRGQADANDAEGAPLYAAFARWSDLNLVDPMATAEAVARLEASGGVTAETGLDLARSLGAGRLVRGAATRVGDSVHIALHLSDATSRGRLIRRASLSVPIGREAAALQMVADSLLFGRISWDSGPETDVGTSSAAARKAYGAAHDALAVWNVERADSLLRLALAHDGDFARARLWLVQLDAWLEVGHWTYPWEPAWLPAARHALSMPGDLTARERVLAAGLVAMAEGRFPDACAGYHRLIANDERDFVAWLGLGECLIRDDRVLPDRSSPSGWRFRASYHRGIEAFRQAFELAHGSHRAFRDGSYTRVRDGILFTRHNRRLRGVSEAGATFSARPQWQADSLALWPFPWSPDQRHPDRALQGVEEALFQQRLTFREIARGWARAEPNSADAVHAVALALEMLGAEAALDTLLHAHSLAITPADQLELSIQEVWLRVKLGSASGAGLERARVIADSVLRSAEASRPALARRMASLAILIGRPSASAIHARRDPVGILGSTLPSSLTGPAAALLVFSAVGAPVDSIAHLERFTETAIRNTLAEEDWPAVRMGLLERSAILAHPVHVFGMLRSPATGATHAPQSAALASFFRGDTASALDFARDISGGTPDMAYPTAALAAAGGDTATAVALLDSSLDGILWLQPGIIEGVAHAGALIRAMALRAELAARAGDSVTAGRWASAVVALWGAGEPAVAPVVDRMRRLD